MAIIENIKKITNFPNINQFKGIFEINEFSEEELKDKKKKDDNTLLNQINHFADVVTKKTKPKVNGNDGLISLKIFAAITKSAKYGKKVKI